MQKRFAYRILVAQKTIIAYYYGDISIDDLINFKLQISENEDYDPHYNLILDFRKCNLNFGPEEIIKYVEFVRNNPKIRAERFTVFLTDKPNEVVLATLFKIRKGNLPLTTEVFTTLEAAINWLFYSFDNLELFKETIETLKKA